MNADVELVQKEYGLVLTDGKLELFGDYSKLLKRIKPSVLYKELLIRAVKIKGKEDLKVLDATAGLGEDSFLLAAAGWDVVLCEYNETIYALLKDTIERSRSIEDMESVAKRMHCVCMDGKEACEIIGAKEEFLEIGSFQPDVVFLDPMFPEKTKNSLTNKKLQLFQKLESPCRTEEELFSAALMTGAKKVVVKRPLKGAYLASKKPSHSIFGKTIRYDCYVL